MVVDLQGISRLAYNSLTFARRVKELEPIVNYEEISKRRVSASGVGDGAHFRGDAHSHCD